jgi:hypothetical protein
MKTKIYALRGDNRFVKYVGKTVKLLEVRLAQHITAARQGDMSHRGCGIRKMLQVGKIPTITLLEMANGRGDKEEMAWIAYFRSYGIVLWNETDGGEGTSFGHIVTAETRAKIGRGNKGKVRSPEVRKRISESLMGKPSHPWTEEQKAKLRASLTGRHHTPEALEKIRIANRNRPPLSEASRAKLSASQKLAWQSSPERRRIQSIRAGAYTHSEEVRAKISKAVKGKKRSEEVRLNISASHTGRPWSKVRRAAYEKRSLIM